MTPTDLLPLIKDLMGAAGGRFHAPDAEVSRGMTELGMGLDAGDQGAPLDQVLLLSGEVSRAGERAPTIIDQAVKRCRPGGMVAVAVPGKVNRELTGDRESSAAWGDEHAVTASTLAHMLAERGLSVTLLASPGAAARMTGRQWRGSQDLDLDATPGLLDVGPVLLAVARTPKSEAERSGHFFASIARKIVSASVLCRDDEGRLLIVFDLFKNGWTLPGGLIDAGEDPVHAAVREAWEEGGVEVEAGELLGVFAHPVPDRIQLVYGASPVRRVPAPQAIHDHEISEVRWVDLDQALELLSHDVPSKVRACLEEPGRTWHW